MPDRTTGRTSAADTIDARLIVTWLSLAADDLHEACPRLTELDAARGDADHGVNMDRGFRAIADDLAARPPSSAAAALLQAAGVLRKVMGGTTGPLWATALRRAGKSLEDDHSHGAGSIADALFAAAEAVSDIGGAREGDNTMLDALLPAARALQQQHQAGSTLPEACVAATAAADEAAGATSKRVARKGRASYLGERGIGTPDPGAVSTAVVIGALGKARSEPEPD
ncbi:dihydroxyacetone kinase subunit DhaL [Streptomyces sp. NPDC001508]|uniref:dihydroxyacetone kinase subunit DhaL n=1 Tax=Streptomyces sp. NPDC001508 TaxID=3154656 RepID=UPI003325DA77